MRASPPIPWLAVATVAVACGLGLWCAQGIVAAVGRPAMPLDDSFIHLVYARSFARGAPLEFVAGEGISRGATSLLWPLLLAPAQWAWPGSLSAIFASWALGWICHGLAAYEAARLTGAFVASRYAKLAAAGMSLGFGAWLWQASSGMESMLFAWLLLCATRLTTEASISRDPRLASRAAIACAFLPLARPEGAAIGLALGLVLFAQHETRARAWLAMGGAGLVPAMYWALTGSPSTSTTTVKWLLANPTLSAVDIAERVYSQTALLLSNVLMGGTWSWLFVPNGFAGLLAVACAALIGFLVWQSSTLRKPQPQAVRPSNHPIPLAPSLFRASAVPPPASIWLTAAPLVILVGATFIPCTFDSFLWNRVRYTWSFAGGWFVVIAIAIGFALDHLARKWRRASDAVGVAVALTLSLWFGERLSDTRDDLVTSAAAIDGQQVSLGLWARDALPSTARIGLNDTGAIAYLSQRATFDIVGLTTEGEARYWVAGAGSRFEHYEKLAQAKLPTHWIAYSSWHAIPPLMGEYLAERTVVDQSILGSPTMIATAADWSPLHKADLRHAGATPHTVLDIADLESEAAHGYGPTGYSAHNFASTSDDGRVDGGRRARTQEHFWIEAISGAKLMLRYDRHFTSATALVITTSSAESPHTGTMLRPGEDAWVEVPLLTFTKSGRAQLTVTAGDGEFAPLHYWVVQ